MTGSSSTAAATGTLQGGGAPPSAAPSKALRSPWTAVIALAVLAVGLFPVFSDDLYYQNMFILSMVFAIGAVGLNVITGYAGYISLGQGAFIGLGAYAVGICVGDIGGSPWVWVPVAGVLAGAVAALLGVVAMRARGHSFVILTIAFLFLVQLLATNWDSLTNGTGGITLPIPTWSVDYQYWPFYYSLMGLLAVSLVASWWIRRTKFGMGLIAIREDEDKAATVGVSTPTYKILAFVSSAVFVGMAGGVYGYYISFIDPLGMFNILLSVQIILSLLLGGRATLWGPVLGAFIIEWLNETTNNEFGGGNARLLIFGGLLALVVLFLPQGIIPTAQSWIERWRSRGKAGLAGERLTGIDLYKRPAPRAEAPPVTGKPLLEVKGLEKRFGGVQAVDGASFSVPEGSITALIGPNGSGKTTVFNLIGGTMAPQAGEVWFDGRRIDGKPPWQRAHLGLGRTFQITRLFREMTVLENVVAPLRGFHVRLLNTDAVSGREARRAEELLEFVGMRKYRDVRASELSYGQQKLVELAQILMLDPRLIMLDEPAGGINPTLIERIGEMIRELNADGKTFLIVEHNMPFVLGLCNPVIVLARGTAIASGTPDEIQRDAQVLDAYLGEDFRLEEPVKA
ncbi:MAG TPA: branched-chain amino acid ABC transporter ATP-binding protein/permease [Thermoleophilaceae bacterium]|nr:branched-chain amino acid ABC transporter ATP-binding protein/permease [Thermoleophilaceae bacterium]